MNPPGSRGDAPAGWGRDKTRAYLFIATKSLGESAVFEETPHKHYPASRPQSVNTHSC